MKDLTSEKAFDNQLKNMKRVVNKRLVDINDYDDFLESLLEQKRQAEMEKNEDFSLGNYSDRFNQEQFEGNQIQNDNYDNAIEQLQNDFESNEIDDDLNSQLSINNDDAKMKPNIIKRITLNLRDNLEEYFEARENYYQDEKEERLAQKNKLLSDWNGALYSARLFGATTLGAVVNILVAIPRFKIFPVELLVGALGMYLFENKKLIKFNDGVFCGNFLLNNKRILPLVKKNRKEMNIAIKETEKEQDEEAQKSNITTDFSNNADDLGSFGGAFDDNDLESNLGGFGGAFDDDLGSGLNGFGDDFGNETNNAFNEEEPIKEESESLTSKKSSFVAEPVGNTSTPNSDFLKKLNLNEKEITPENLAPSEIVFEDEKYEARAFHEQANRIYREFYDNRKELGKLAKSRQDIFRIFAPIISKFNKNFGEFTPISNNSNVVKNLAYVFYLTFCEIDNSFKRISQKDFNPDYYIFIGNCTETALYYKIDFKLPSTLSLNVFMKNLFVVKRYLKAHSMDSAVEISVEQQENGGALKIFKVKSVPGKGNLLPAISTGDILRFKGMKIYGQDILKNLTSKGDYRCLIGMRDGEYPAIQDFGEGQNTNLAVVGGSGAGKSLSIISMLLNTLLIYPPEEVGLIVMDPKNNKEWKIFKNFPHILGYFDKNDFEHYADILEVIDLIKDVRGKYFEKEVKSDKSNIAEARLKYSKNLNLKKLKKVPRLIVICDEMYYQLTMLDTVDRDNDMYNKTKEKDEPKKSTFNKKRYTNALTALATTVREMGITIIAISQRAINDGIPLAFLKSGCSMRLWMRGDQGDFKRVTEQTNKNVTDLPTGSGYFYASGDYKQGIKVNTSLTCGSPDANNEFIAMFSYLWNILQANRGVDMFDETDSFGIQQLNDKSALEKLELNQKKIKKASIQVVNRPKLLVQTVRNLYNGTNIFQEELSTDPIVKYDIVDDVLANISESSKKRFPKEYAELVAIKYPEKAKELNQNNFTTDNRSSNNDNLSSTSEKPQENELQKQLKHQMQSTSTFNPEINDDNDKVSIGNEVLTDGTFDDEEDDEYVYNGGTEMFDDDDQFNNTWEQPSVEQIDNETLQKTADKSDTISEKENVQSKQNFEPTPKDLEMLFGKQNDVQNKISSSEQQKTDEQVKTKVEQTTALTNVNNSVGEKVEESKRIIDDGTHDRPQTIESIRKYCRVHNIKEISLEELQKYFSNNAINASVNNNILMTGITKNTFIVVG